ncbi:hypothetical protein SAMN04488570_1244 [Nocardioides scoriae]|uniref:Mce-associated membrane protein n=1 Tax=Nocardioides scoriae TaxID=642780 RepID=A0A1H1PV42_9ACTN|nr:hypothetical protein [Nocardioides scoriae]SDS15070.1 hypothetical protein SAMN04488570_1244 [Nocardioides scoriae]
MSAVGQRTSRTGAGTALVLLLVVVVLGATTALGWWWRDQGAGAARPTLRTPVTSVTSIEPGSRAAAELSARVLSYDWGTFDADATRVEADLAPGFREDYARTMRDTRSEALAEKVVLRAAVRDSAVVSASARRVVALVYLDQVTSAQGSMTQRRDQTRVLVTVTRDGGQWRVSRMDAF